MTKGREKGIKIEISVAQDECGHFDFGNFESKKHIKVNRYWWSQYIEKRSEFEIMHQVLIKNVK